MTTLEDELSTATPLRDSYLSIGVFDGVHLGHRHLLELLVREAHQAGCVPGVVTFRNHPRPVLSPEVSIPVLTPVEERARLMRDLGVEVVVPITFTLEVSRVTASGFVDLLQRCLRMRGLVVGPDFTLGHNREGTPEVLGALGKEKGFSVTVADTYTNEGVRISSNVIREALAQGDLTTVSRYLGRRHSLAGNVVHGEGRGGSELGYPTANISVEPELALPADGIYATWAYVDQHRYQAATSIGVRPTFGVGQRTTEAFLLDFQGDLYHKEIRLEFVQRLRDEEAFESAEALRKQIDVDVEQTRRVLGGLAQV